MLIALAAVLGALLARLVEPRSTTTAGIEGPVDVPALRPRDPAEG